MSREDGAGMGRFVNPDNSAFRVTLNSKIYVDNVYFDCAEPSARMLRASLAEDESHLHGRLSQVKFDNTSVC